MDKSNASRHEECTRLQTDLLAKSCLIIAANRAPVTFSQSENGELSFRRSSGGLVTALTGLAQHVRTTWIASASNEGDRQWGEGEISLPGNSNNLRVQFLAPDPAAYHGYYHVIANPLLWFLQHNMWDIARSPTINRETWEAWDQGYVQVNRLFAGAVANQIQQSGQPSLVMFQDYHLYLAPLLLRQIMRSVPAGARQRYTLMHFIHIPWPGPEVWGFLPPGMRRAILEGLCAVDLLGFQTREDGLNFLRTCENYLPRAYVRYTRGRVWFRNHSTHVRDFPISIDVEALRHLAHSSKVAQHRQQLQGRIQDRQLILRIDRIDPSKNIIRGFQAFDELLENYPEHRGKVIFYALLVPSRLMVEEYQEYLDEIMASVGRVNARFGTSEWEPVRVLVGQNYPRAVGAMQLYDVLLVNSIADGMNLVAKEGPIANQRAGVMVLSERTGARQQLEAGALVISPCDVYATSEALHQSLVMALEERRERATRLTWLIEREDIEDWLCRQLESLVELGLWKPASEE